MLSQQPPSIPVILEDSSGNNFVDPLFEALQWMRFVEMNRKTVEDLQALALKNIELTKELSFSSNPNHDSQS